MVRDAELTGIVRPELDDNALDRASSKMSETFDKAAEITPDIDTRKLTRQIEKAIPGAGLLTDALGIGGSGGGGGGSGGMTQLLEDQLETLDDIKDEIEKLGVSGGIGGGGGGGRGGLLGSSGRAGLFGGIGSKLAGGLGTLGGGALGLGATAAGAGAAGLGLGLAGTKVLSETGALDAIQQTGSDVASGAPDGLTESALSLGNTVTLGGLEGLTVAGGGIKGLVESGSLSGAADEAAETSEAFGEASPVSARNLGSGLSDAVDELEKVSLPSIDVPDEPDWLDGIETPDAPDWLSDLKTPEINAPDWLSQIPGVGGNEQNGQDGGLGQNASTAAESVRQRQNLDRGDTVAAGGSSTAPPGGTRDIVGQQSRGNFSVKDFLLGGSGSRPPVQVDTVNNYSLSKQEAQNLSTDEFVTEGDFRNVLD